MRIDTTLMGLWLLVDGIASLIYFRKQGLFEQSIRLIRVVIAILLIMMV